MRTVVENLEYGWLVF